MILLTERELLLGIADVFNHKEGLMANMTEKLIECSRLNLLTPKIMDGVNIVLMKVHEKEHNDFKVACEIVAPTLKRLENIEQWDIDELFILSQIVGHTTNYQELAQKLLTKLEEFKSEKSYKGIKACIHNNTMFRVVREKVYNKIDKFEDEKEYNRLDAIIQPHYYALEEMCKSDKGASGLHKALGAIRFAIFRNDDVYVHHGFNMLDNMGGHEELIKLLYAEMGYYNPFYGEKADQHLFNFIVGRNIKRLRLAAGLSEEQVAKAIHATKQSINILEEGEWGIESMAVRFAQVFNVSVAELYVDTDIIVNIFKSIKEPIKRNEFATPYDALWNLRQSRIQWLR